MIDVSALYFAVVVICIIGGAFLLLFAKKLLQMSFAFLLFFVAGTLLLGALPFTIDLALFVLIGIVAVLNIFASVLKIAIVAKKIQGDNI
ncbi:MAG: hypothetical protein ACTSYD_01600 [Candidatus Heimdallarchaeaceae archaeon]